MPSSGHAAAAAHACDADVISCVTSAGWETMATWPEGTSTVVAPLYGKLSDIHGRGAMMVASIVIFVVGSAACAISPNMISLILARGLQGIGGGGRGGTGTERIAGPDRIGVDPLEPRSGRRNSIASPFDVLHRGRAGAVGLRPPADYQMRVMP